MEETKQKPTEERAFTVCLPESLHKQVRIEAVKREMTLKELVTAALKKFLCQ